MRHTVHAALAAMASLLLVAPAAPAQQVVGESGSWRVESLGVSCAAWLTGPNTQPGSGSMVRIDLDGDQWSMVSDFPLAGDVTTTLLIDGRAFQARFERHSDAASALIRPELVRALRTARRLNLNFDPTGPQYALRGTAGAFDLLEGCARQAASAAAPAPVAAGVDWVPQSGGSIPQDAPAAGRDTNGQPLFLCLADHNGGQHPGKIRPGFHGCDFGYGGREITAHSHSVLVGRDAWAPAANGQIPPQALRSGQEADGSALFACRIGFRGSLQLGKIRPGFGGCNFSYGGQEFTGTSYEVLVP